MIMSPHRRTPAARPLRRSFGALLAAALFAAACDSGTSPTPKPDPQNPVPTVASVSPATLMQGSDSATVTVTGSGFVNGTVVRLSGAALPTAYVSASQLTAVIPATALQQTGTLQLTAFNAAPGGGESGTVDVAVHHRAPAIAQLAPALVMQGSGAFTLTVTGTGFSQASVVRWKGQNRPTTFVNAGQLTAQIAATDVQAADSAQVTVFTPAPGGGESGALPVAVHYRAPEAIQLYPSTVMERHGAFTLTVSGAGFAVGSVVRWNGEDRPTTFLSPVQLTAQIAAADVQAVGTAQVTIFTPAPGGGTSAAIPFVVAVRPNPVPVAGTLAPSTVMAETRAEFTLTGSGFIESTHVSVGGYMPAVTVVSANELRFVLEAENVPNAGFAEVRVTNPAPGGGGSNVLSLRVDNPQPVLTALSPAAAVLGADSQVVQLTGMGFVRGSTVWVNGVQRPSRRTSPTAMEAVLPAADLDEAASLAVTVRNAAPGGGVSGAMAFVVQNPAPVAQGAVPAQTEALQDSIRVRVMGSGFVPGSAVWFQHSERVTRYVSATELEAVLTAADLAEPGTFTLTVTSPSPGGGISASVPFTVVPPVPVLTMLPSNGASAGRPGFPLVVYGTGFMRNSVVQWNGQARPTSYVSSTRLEMVVTGADVAALGVAQVSVHTPGGGTSNATQLTIRTAGSAAITATRTLPLPAVDMVYEPRSNRIYAALSPEAGEHANAVVAIDPATGGIVHELVLGSSPTVLALSDDGSTLWVGLRGSGAVRRISLPDFTPGLVFSLNGRVAEEIVVMPGRPGTVAISLSNTCCSPRHEGVAVYDDGVRRSRTTGGHTGSNSIAFGESGAVLYGYNNETTEFGFRTMSVTSEGLATTHVVQSLIDGFGQRIQFANGRVYSTGGDVLDAARRVRAGSFAGSGADLAVDPDLGRIFFADDWAGTVAVFDLNTMQRLGTVPTGQAWRVVRWGTDGLAIATSAGIQIIRTPIAGP